MPKRVKKTTWAEFMESHWDVLAATDFFTVDVWTGGGRTRFAVLFIIELSTRRVEVAGIASEPDLARMNQVSRNVTECERWLYDRQTLPDPRLQLDDRDVCRRRTTTVEPRSVTEA